ncbi:hypothetical protein C8R47DRAFT_358083 [Mycena vitilis]|nr:hypothetical protein C8R47DRAFT_358083 [Mycena vitilis]
MRAGGVCLCGSLRYSACSSWRPAERLRPPREALRPRAAHGHVLHATWCCLSSTDAPMSCTRSSTSNFTRRGPLAPRVTTAFRSRFGSEDRRPDPALPPLVFGAAFRLSSQCQIWTKNGRSYSCLAQCSSAAAHTLYVPHKPYIPLSQYLLSSTAFVMPVFL